MQFHKIFYTVASLPRQRHTLQAIGQASSAQLRVEITHQALIPSGNTGRVPPLVVVVEFPANMVRQAVDLRSIPVGIELYQCIRSYDWDRVSVDSGC